MTEAVGYVYAIENAVNGRRYIGSTTNYKSRWHTHKSALRRGKHHSFILQKAWDKYGEKSFEFKLLLICPKDMRIEYEERLMPLQDYNVMRTAHEVLVRGGWKHSDEFKAKMSALHKGKSLSKEHIEKVRVAQLGRKMDQQFRDKARARQLGVSPSSKTRSLLSAALKNAKADVVAINTELARKIYASCLGGATISSMCKLHKLSTTSFHKYVQLLGLPPLGHKKRGSAA